MVSRLRLGSMLLPGGPRLGLTGQVRSHRLGELNMGIADREVDSCRELRLLCREAVRWLVCTYRSAVFRSGRKCELSPEGLALTLRRP